MTFIYNFFTYAASHLLPLVATFNKKIKVWQDERKGWQEKLEQLHLENNKCNIWFHCASLGEYEQGKPVMEALKCAFPEVFLIVTFFSPSGYQARKNSTLADFIGYLPLDTPTNAKLLVGKLHPRIAIFVKSEIWPNTLKVLKDKHVPCFLISARFYEGQSIFSWKGKFTRNQLKKFDFIFVQNNISRKLLKRYEIASVLSGDTRFDQVAQLPLNPTSFPLVEQFKGENDLLIVGSCWEQDLEVLLPFINDNDDSTKIILAPHDVGLEMIETIISKLKVSFLKFSTIENEDKVLSTKVLIVDSIGKLAHLYQYGTVAFVGGAFKQGLHNILEPASFGIPVIFGPHIEGFPEAKEILEEGGAFSVQNALETKEILQKLFNNKDWCRTKGNSNKHFVEKRRGATEKIMASLRMLLSSKFDKQG